MKDTDAAVALVAAAAVAVCSVRFRDSPGLWERRLFEVVNEWPNPWLLRIPQQLGTPWALPATGAALWALGRRREAVAAAVALPAVKLTEVRIKRVIDRRRPLWETPTILRDDAPREGPSFPSGHAAIAAAAAYLLARAWPPSAAPLALATSAASLVRVHQGAHWPSDALAGGALGVGVAATLRRVLVPPS